MVNSYVYYTGDGSTTNFQITFDYLSKEFVQVYLDGTMLDVETDYIFAGDRTILIPSIPPSGSIVFIRRVTSKDRLVEFRDAYILVANDLDVSALQAIHIAEEANDNIQNVIQADPNGNFDVLNRRLVNVDSPVDGTDGANKAYVDTCFAADVAAAVAARDAAVVAQGLSEDARDAAEVARDAAYGFANTADVRATQASGSAVVAAQSAMDAQAAAQSAATNAASDVAALLSGYVTDAEGFANDAEQAALAALNIIPAGFVAFYAKTTAPDGWLKANGATISRTTYSALFEAIGTRFGAGDGSTTFKIPDLRGEFVRGWDDGRGVDSGRTLGTAQGDAFKSHTHNILAGTDESDAGPKVRGGGTSATSGTSVTEATGSTETRPRNIALMACIKY